MDRTDSRLAPSPGPSSDDAASPSSFQPRPRPDRLDFEPVPLRHRHDGLTPEKQHAYVEALADCGIVREAAARIGVSEQAINRVRRRADAVSFDRACEAASMFGARRLRSVAYERAIEGTIKGHYYHGERVGEERVFDNRLLIYLLGKTEHLLEPSEESRAICEHWEPYMEALAQGLPTPELVPPTPEELDRRIDEDEDPQVWRDDDGTWWTFFPPPEGFDGEEEGDLGEDDYQRTLTREEVAAMEARNRAAEEAVLARCCADRDRYFGLPSRGRPDAFSPQESRNNEPSGDGKEAEAETEAEAEAEAEVEAEADAAAPSPSPSPSRRRRPKSMNRKSGGSEAPCSPVPGQARHDDGTALPPVRGTPQSMNTEAPDPERPCPPIPDQARKDGEGDDSPPLHIQTPASRHPFY